MFGLLNAQVSKPGKGGLRREELKVEQTNSPQWAIPHRSPHQARWESVLSLTNPGTGKVRMQTNAFIVLGAGLHYLLEGQWRESREAIEIIDGGAVARHGPHQVAFANNLNTGGAIVLLTPDGHQLSSHVLGLAYADAATGKCVLIAGIKDCVGSVHSNQVHYPYAFDGRFRADVRYTYTISGLEQDVVLLEQPPPPSEYGLDPRTTRLEVWTEFLQPPVPERTRRNLKGNRRAAVVAAASDPSLSDETLQFGTMMIGTGVAFPLEHDQAPGASSSAPVGKEWLTIRGRTFLIEKVEYSEVESGVRLLPKAGVAKTLTNEAPLDRPTVLAGLASPPLSTPANRGGKMQFAAHSSLSKGYVVDYSIVATIPNHVFRGDTTYLVVGNCVLSGTTVIEGGAVIKFTNGVKNRIVVTGPVDCQTASYRPAYFVSMNDDTVGEPIPGSSGLSVGDASGGGLELDGDAPTHLHDLRFRKLQRAITVDNGSFVTLSHSQILSCQFGVQTLANSIASLRNVLLVDLFDTAFALDPRSELRGEHLTLHRAGRLRTAVYGIPTGAMELANSLLVSVTNIPGGADGDWRKVFVESSEAGVFQTAGHGNHYLAAESPFRAIGDANIDPNLLVELRRTSTHPPVVLSGKIDQDVILRPMVQRNGVAETNPDIGYAYDAMDYLLRGLSVEGNPGQSVTLLVTNGAVVGLDPAASGTGVQFGPYCAMVSVGRPESLNRITPVQTIQEASFSGQDWFFTQLHGVGLGGYPTASLRLTELSVPAGRFRHFANWGGSFPRLDFQDCRLAGGEFYLSPDSPSHLISVKNSLFERVKFTFHAYARAGLTVYNSLFKEGALVIDTDPPNPSGSAPWIIRDNLFDGTRISQVTDLPAGGATHNGYVLTPQNQSRLHPIPSGNTDRMLFASPRYEAVGDRRYYLPSNDPSLTDRGSRSASAAGLYHHTTHVGQAKEGTSTVDIGFHYIAFSGENASDVDLDGVSDYVEDQNGDGITSSLETRWNGYESRYGLAGSPGLSVFTPIR
jgi:hypothetical protein